MMSRKTPAQMLFERIVQTWIVPEANARGRQDPEQGPIPLRLAFIVWDRGDNCPSVYFNDEVFGRVERISAVAARKINTGERLTPEDIKGVERARLAQRHWGQSYIFICQGKDERYYITFGKIGALSEAEQFQALKEPLAREGVRLTSEDIHLPVAIDLIQNSYAGLPAHKRQWTLELKRIRLEAARKSVTNKVRRHLRLPAYMVHEDDEVLPLLLEARETYVDGHFFSCVAASATAADRICIGLLNRYGVTTDQKRKILQYTFGEKLEPMKALKLISDKQLQSLQSLNKLRKKHLHPGRPVADRAANRDALKALTLLHEFLEGTLSVFRDYVIENGKLMPRHIT